MYIEYFVPAVGKLAKTEHWYQKGGVITVTVLDHVVQVVAWLLLAAFCQMYNENWGQKAEQKTQLRFSLALILFFSVPNSSLWNSNIYPIPLYLEVK